MRSACPTPVPTTALEAASCTSSTLKQDRSAPRSTVPKQCGSIPVTRSDPLAPAETCRLHWRPPPYESRAYDPRMVDEESCMQCGHPFDPHAMIATSGVPADGGIMLCPVVDCECFATWGLDNGPAKVVPDRFEVAAIRERIQHPDQQ
jgi:hypothetical protein